MLLRMVSLFNIFVILSLSSALSHAGAKTLFEQAIALKRAAAWDKSILERDFLTISDLSEKAKLANDFKAINVLRDVFLSAVSSQNTLERTWAVTHLKELMIYNDAQYKRILSSSSNNTVLYAGLFELSSLEMLDQVLVKIQPLLASADYGVSQESKLFYREALRLKIYALLNHAGSQSSRQVRQYVQEQKWVLEALKAASAQAEIDHVMRQIAHMLSGTPLDYASVNLRNLFRDAFSHELAAIALGEFFVLTTKISAIEIARIIAEERTWHQRIIDKIFSRSTMNKDLYRQLERANEAFSSVRMKYGCEIELTRP